MQRVLPAPYKDEGLNNIYNLLFCDQPTLYKPESLPLSYPWNVLMSAAPSENELRKITEDESIETRQVLLAYQLLADQGYQAHGRELLGVVIEVGLDDGLDTLAAYKDGTARYINHSGRMIVWEAKNARAELLIDTLFDKSQSVVKNIGPWDKDRLPAPGVGNVRLSFLVSDGLYFGQGPFDVLEADAMGGLVIHAATRLMVFLTEQKA